MFPFLRGFSARIPRVVLAILGGMMTFNWVGRSARARKTFGALVGACLFLLVPVRAGAWGCEGHQAVAMIAEKHMSAHALEMANKVLQSNPIDPTLSRFCTGATSDLIVYSSTWADDYRKVRPETGPWHYLDLPRDAPRSAMAQACPADGGCVTVALARQIDLLRSDGTDPKARADALRFVIHLVGDMHQPMHCVSNNDEGGNCVPIIFFGSAPVEKNPLFESYSPNLHALWDYGIIVRMKGEETVEQWAASLDQQFKAQDSNWEKAGMNFDDWAWEGHQLADTVAYGKLPVAVPVEAPVPMKSCADDNHISTRMLKLDEHVSQAYVDAVAPTINEQIAKAGIRLAMVLDQIWP